ncbi:beta-lactamase regulator AmpE [Psychrobium sp. nBUS_13]|uniref:beta-lactamase regulator AmpE n=1 Tax=Psychrobium sp. nBUS_13 TaxID=3395319 RepID=UPI003EBEEA21
MALFSLLLALIIERTTFLSKQWQFQHWHLALINSGRKLLEPTSISFALFASLLPALVTYLLLNLIQGWIFGLVSVVLWTLIALMCIGCVHYRELYKRYLLSVCKQDTQGSYHLAAQLADVEDIDTDDETMLGTRVGRQLAWINYRFYCAIVFMMIIGGPVAIVFYASLRSLELLSFKGQLPTMSWVRRVLFVLDWIPARIIAFAYVLVGNFSNAMSVWLSLSVNFRAPAYDVVSKVAMSAEQMSKSQGEAGVCMQSTCRLVSLAKRTLILLVIAMSFLTIFGYLI